jgi:hypothetical protein
VTRAWAAGAGTATEGAAVAAFRDATAGSSSAWESFVCSVVPATTGITAVATVSPPGVATGLSARMLPNQAIRLAKANPNTKEITREVESVASGGSVLTGHADGAAACSR